MRRATSTITLIACAALALALPVAGCGGGDDTSAPTRTAATPPEATTTVETSPAQTAPEPPSPDLPGLDAADAALIEGYLGWTPLPEPPIADLRSLGGAHPGTKRIFASPPMAELVAGGAQRFPYPRGTVVMKEARSGGAVTLVAIMEKVRANDDATGGWRYVEYNRAGASEPFAKVNFAESGCAGCHMNANSRQATDWVFFSLR